MYYILSKLCYLAAFICLVALTVTAFRTPVTASDNIITFRYYAVAALVGILVGCAFGLKKRIDKKRNNPKNEDIEK